MKKYFGIICAAFINIITVIEFYDKYDSWKTAVLYTTPVLCICLLVSFLCLYFDFRRQGKKLKRIEEDYNRLICDNKELIKRHKAISSQYADKKNENNDISKGFQIFVEKWIALGIAIDHAAKDKKNNRIKEIQDFHKKLSESIIDKSSYKEK